MVWKYFVFVFLSYWVTGMSEASAYYGDLNMWFVLAVALLYNYGSSGTASQVEYGVAATR